MSVAETFLRQYGVDPEIEAILLNRLPPEERYSLLRQNLEAYTNEVVRDEPVSILYYYWFDEEGNLYSNPYKDNVTNFSIDREERGGLYVEGLKRLANLLFTNPNQVILWYSPPGPALFDENPQSRYFGINYDYGQLYWSYFDGEKVVNLAIKISNEEIVNYLFASIPQFQDEKERIAFFVLNPSLSGFTPDDFFEKTSQEDNTVVYQSKNGRRFTWADILRAMRITLTGKKNQEPTIFDKTTQALFEFEMTAQTILQIYLSTIYHHMMVNNLTSLPLSGSCGGKEVSLSSLEEGLEIDNGWMNPFAQVVSSLSSGFRFLTQTGERWEHHDGVCVICHQKAKVGPCNVCKNCEKNL